MVLLQAVKLLADSDPRVRIAAAMAIGRWAANAGTIVPHEMEGPLVRPGRTKTPRSARTLRKFSGGWAVRQRQRHPAACRCAKKDADCQVAGSAAVALSRIAVHREEGKPSLRLIIEALGVGGRRP